MVKLKKELASLRKAVSRARAHVYRQIHHGRHEQDRWDAYVWWQTWGDHQAVYPIPQNPAER
jgi:hypothetical protein